MEKLDRTQNAQFWGLETWGQAPGPLVERQMNGMHRTAVLSQKTPTGLIFVKRKYVQCLKVFSRKYWTDTLYMCISCYAEIG